MDRPKWRFTIGKDGKLKIEGHNFTGSQCVEDIIYQLVKQQTTIENEEHHASFNDETPVENIYYVNV